MRIAAILLVPVLGCAQGVISTIAGNGASTTSGDGGPATSASFHPDGMTLDKDGNIYISDLGKSVIRKINTAGIITTVAGNGNGSTVFAGDGGPATNATIYIAQNHNGLAVDAAGNLYIPDDGHQRVRKVDPSGTITTVAGTGSQVFAGDGGPANKATLYRPSAVAFDRDGNLYIADNLNFRVRKVDTAGNISTIAGSGLGIPAGDGGPAVNAIVQPMGIAVDSAGNIYIADESYNAIRKVNTAGIISTVAGGTFGFSGDGGPATSASLAGPRCVTVDSAGNLYICDFGNRRVRKVEAGSGVITTVAGGAGGPAGSGDGGPPTSANLQPVDIALDSAGNMYIADFSGNRIRKVTVGATVPGLSASVSSLYFSYVAGANAPSAQVVSVSTVGVVPLGFTVSTSVASGPTWLNATFPGGSTPSFVTVAVQSGFAAGNYKGTVTLTPTAPGLPPLRIPVTLDVVTTGPPRPSITGAENGASFRPGVAANSWATIVGTNLASTTTNWDSVIASGQLPTSLGGVTVLFSGKPGYLSYISPTQINVLVPDVTSAVASVVVNNSGSVGGPFNTPAASYGPAFFTWPGNQVVATHQDYSLAVKNGTFPGATTVAAKPGDVLILWGTGFGPTTPAVPLGAPVPSDRTYAASAAPKVTINNIDATVYGAALASGYAGLYQVAIQVPPSLPDGDWILVATAGGVQSPTDVVLSVKR